MGLVGLVTPKQEITSACPVMGVTLNSVQAEIEAAASTEPEKLIT